LGFGTFASGATSFTSVNGTTPGTDGITGTAPAGAALSANLGQTLQISVAGGTAINISTGALGTQNAAAQGATIAATLNTAIAANATLTAAGLKVTADSSTGALTIGSANGTSFRLNATSLDNTGVAATTATNIGFGTSGNATVAASTSNTLLTDSNISATGSSATAVYAYNPTANQTVGFTAYDASGAAHTLSVSLVNNTATGGTNNAQTIDQAISSINTQLQSSGDATLSTIVAVKADTTSPTGVVTQGIQFISSLASFNVSLGAEGTATSQQGIGTAAQQGTTQVSSAGSQSDISSAAGAQTAVNTLANAVTALGSAQANVGKSENLLNYAVALATTQVTNEAAAESRIRDANLATEAANLSKAQILMQAGTAALAQANSAPQAILSLLK
jgi:flagellin